MQRFLSIATGLLLGLAVLVPLPAAAQTPSPGSTPPPGPSPGSMPPPPGGNLDAAKQRRLAEIQQRMAMLQAEQTCVQNAQDHDQLRACRPPKRNP